MSAFVVKMLTLLGFVLHAGGPIDAIRLAIGDEAGVEAVCGGQGCEQAALTAQIPVKTAHLLRPAIGEDRADAFPVFDKNNDRAGLAGDDPSRQAVPQGTVRP